MIVLYNPTNEMFEMQFEGRTYRIGPEEKLRVSEACGKHLLTGYGPRGLTGLEFGDEANIDQIRADGIKRNREFKLKCVIEYNQRNESRKQMNMPFLIPPEHIKNYARELNIELIAPFSVREEENARIQALTEQNRKLGEALDKRDAEMAQMREMLESLMKSIKADQAASEAKKEAKGAKVS